MNFNIKGAIQFSFFIFICVEVRLGNKKDRERDMKLSEVRITRKEMGEIALFADAGVPVDKKKWKVSRRAAKRKFGEATSEAKKRYAQKHYRESGGTFR